MTETKKCSRCKLFKEVTSFGSLKSSKDGYAYVCKECYKVIYEQYKPIKFAEKVCECGREVKVMRVHLKSKLHNQWLELKKRAIST
jgi:hypothetical protein